MRIPSNPQAAIRVESTAVVGSRYGPGAGGGVSSQSSPVVAAPAQAPPPVVRLQKVDAPSAEAVPNTFDASSSALVDGAAKEEANSAKPVPRVLEELVARANQDITHGNHRIEVSKDDGSGRFVMRIVDKGTGEVLRQYPPESVVRMSERLNELSGMLLAFNA